MSHTHPKYAWEPIDGTKVTRKCATLKKKQIFNAWTKYGNGKNISLTTTRFGLLHGVLVQTADTINIECLICKYWRSLEFTFLFIYKNEFCDFLRTVSSIDLISLKIQILGGKVLFKNLELESQ